MTSPDLPTSVTLTLHTVDENDMVDAMVAAFLAAEPGWVAQEGATEVVLMESFSLLVGQQIYALNQLPRVVLDGLIAIRGIARHPAVPAYGNLTITLAASTTGTRVVPVGARFRLPAGADTVDMVASEELSINPTDGLTGVLPVTSADPGDAANGIIVGTAAQVVDALAWIESAVVSTQIGGGAPVETDAAYYSRAAAVFQRSNGALVIDSQFATAALDVVGVGRAAAWGLWDSTGSPGSDPGHITVALTAPDGSPVSAGIKTAVTTLLTASAVAGLAVHVIDFTLVTMSLDITYVVADGYEAAQVSDAIEADLLAWLSPASWPLGQELTHDNQVILRLGTIPGVADVTALTGRENVSGAATLPSCTAVNAHT